MSPRSTLHAAIAAATAATATLALTWALLGLPIEDFAATRLDGPFHDGHVWAFDHMARMVSGDLPVSVTTDRIGWPETVEVRFLGWVPALLALPLRPLLGPLGGYLAALLSGPVLATLAAFALARRVTGCRAWVAAGASIAYGLCPYALGLLLSGQAEKQHWIVPAWLLALSVAAGGPRRWAGVLGAAAVAAAGSFTTPDTVVFLPLAGLPWAALEALRARRADRGAFLGTGAWATGALLATLIAVLPARAFYGDFRGDREAFEPGVANEGIHTVPTPMAQPEGLLLGRGNVGGTPREASHVAYLGLPLLAAAGLLSIRRFPGRGRAWTCVAVGAALALGHHLVSGNAWVLVGGHRVPLPAQILEAIGYPTARSGMYYRAAAVSALGLAVAWAGAVGALPARGRWSAAAIAMLAWIGGLGQVADGWRATRSAWPPPSGPVPGRAALEALAADPAPGAVLEWPVEGGTYEGGVHLLASVVHGRSTTGLPRQNRRYLPRVARLDAAVREALALGDPPAARARLAAWGLRAVVLRPDLTPREEDRRAALEGLGPPTEVDGLWIWTLPTPGAPR